MVKNLPAMKEMQEMWVQSLDQDDPLEEEMEDFIFNLLSIKFSMCVHAKLLQLCLNLCNPMECNPPDSSVHVILQARILEWMAMPFSRGSFPLRDQTQVSYVSWIGRQFLYSGATWEAQSINTRYL